MADRGDHRRPATGGAPAPVLTTPGPHRSAARPGARRRHRVGLPEATVPDVGSSRVQSAVDKLAGAGLLVTLAYVPSSSPLGTAVAESPSAGSSAPAESQVIVYTGAAG